MRDSNMQVQMPYLRATSTSKQLVVNGEPFLMCAGELQNSSFTSSKYMAEAWPKLAESNLNTVLGSVTWEQIEPEEDRFDFSELDACLHGARQYDLKLVLLWFGSFKNGEILA
jgi:beta-galactosidase GanA